MDRSTETDSSVGGSDAAHTAVRIAFVPATPVLVPELTGDPDGVAPIRRATTDALQWLLSDPRPIAVLAVDDQTRDLGADSYRITGLGRDLGSGNPTGLAVAIARYVLAPRQVPAYTIAVDADRVACQQRTSQLPAGHNWLVMGDASAGRDEKSPGHLLHGSEQFDDSARNALAGGDSDALAALDLGEADAVWAAGGRAWKVIGSAIASVTESHLDAVESPFGVTYFVARWRAQWASPA